MTTLRWGSVTDVGMVREANQDGFLVVEPLFAVADGMGGHQGGEVASAMALEILERTFNEEKTTEGLLEAVRKANAKVWDKAQLDDTLHGMGTTLTAAAHVVNDEDEEVLAVVNVGDSRTYLFREGELKQVTTDHSFVEEMVRAGEITTEDAESHPKRNILTRALGVEPTIEVDIHLFSLQDGDRVLLCSDGLVRELTDNQIEGILRRLKNPQEAAQELIVQAKAHGGHDNITVVVVDAEGQAEPVTNAPKKQSKKSKVKVASAPKSKGGKITFRMLLFFVAVLALVGVGAGSVVWYARSAYFVALEGAQLVVYRGHPDKVLWFEPTIAERTNINESQVLPSALPALQKGATQSSLESAHKYINNLVAEARSANGQDVIPLPYGDSNTSDVTTTLTP